MLEIFCGYFVAALCALAYRSSRHLISFHFTGKHCSCSGCVDFRLPARFRHWDSMRGERERGGLSLLELTMIGPA